MRKLEKAWSRIYDISLKICCTNFQLCYIFLPKYLCEKENFKSMTNSFIKKYYLFIKKIIFSVYPVKKNNCSVFDFLTTTLLAKCNREITFDKCDYEAHRDLQSSSSVIVGQM